MKSRRNGEAGFTLVEVLVVIFILSLIMALVIPNYTQSSERAQGKLCQLNKENIEAQLELYWLDNGKLPDGSDDAARFQTMVNEGYLKEMPECPSGGTYAIEATNRTVSCSVHDKESSEG